MTTRAADDFDFIRRELRRNRVVDMCVAAGLAPPCDVPDEIFLAAGFTPDEIAALPSIQRRWPILETELR
jgi:hypothetical protein